VSFLILFHWLAATHLGLAMRDSTWAFAIVEVVHLLSLALFGGSILFVDMRLLGFSFTSQPAPRVMRELLPLTGGGVIVMFLTGALLLSSGPMRYYYNTPFRIKMWLFFIAVALHFVLQTQVARIAPEMYRSTSLQKAGAMLSLLLWAGVGISGRAIGYF
jgi:hypothetical protein